MFLKIRYCHNKIFTHYEIKLKKKNGDLNHSPLGKTEYACQSSAGFSWHVYQFQIRKGVHQGCILSLCLFNVYAKYIMWNAGLNESQAGFKISRRNINSLRYADDPTLMAESEEEIEPLDEVERGEWKSWLKT